MIGTVSLTHVNKKKWGAIWLSSFDLLRSRCFFPFLKSRLGSVSQSEPLSSLSLPALWLCRIESSPSGCVCVCARARLCFCSSAPLLCLLQCFDSSRSVLKPQWQREVTLSHTFAHAVTHTGTHTLKTVMCCSEEQLCVSVCYLWHLRLSGFCGAVLALNEMSHHIHTCCINTPFPTLCHTLTHIFTRTISAGCH